MLTLRKVHTSGTVPAVPIYSQLYSICYRGDGFDSIVAARKSTYKQGVEDKG